MAKEELSTLNNILDAGRAEFLEKGFKSASLRNIVKTAGVTTGAFYGYFSGKEALFAALVEEHAKAIMNIFMSAQEDFEKLPEEEKANHMGVESRTSLNEIVDYIYEHFDEFKLIICKSEGTSYENFIHNMVEIEVEEETATPTPNPDPQPTPEKNDGAVQTGDNVSPMLYAGAAMTAAAVLALIQRKRRKG